MNRKIKSIFKIATFNAFSIALILLAYGGFKAFKDYQREYGHRSNLDFKNNRGTYDASHPYQLNQFPTEESLKQYFKSELNISLVDRLSPGALIDSQGISVKGINFFPFTSLGNKKTLFCEESGFWIVYDSDRYGFRNNDKVWNNDIDAVFLGDSFTHGACIEETDTFSGRFIKAGHNALNLGIGGTGSLIQLGVLKEYVIESGIKPKYVVWVYFDEDFRDNWAEKDSYHLSQYLENKDFIQNMQLSTKEGTSRKDELLSIYIENEYPKLLDRLIRLKSGRKAVIKERLLNKVLQFSYIRELISNSMNPGKSSQVLETFKGEKTELAIRAFDRINSEVNSIGSRLVFVYIPSWVRYGDGFDSYGIDISKDDYLGKNALLAHAKEKEVLVIDIDEFIETRNPKTWFNYDTYGHFTPEGYRNIGDFITQSILNNQ